MQLWATRGIARAVDPVMAKQTSEDVPLFYTHGPDKLILLMLLRTAIKVNTGIITFSVIFQSTLYDSFTRNIL